MLHAMTTEPLPCPACKGPMTTEHYAGHYGRQVELDACHACNTMWFDKMENLALSAGGVIALLRSMQQRADHDRQPLPDALHCPRCGGVLRAERRRTKDIQYTVQACRQGHGHFITFYELLREKDCIRPLKGDKLKELRKQVSVVSCSSCGAPIDLHKTVACTHCGAPLAMLDPEALAETLDRLDQEDDRQRNPDADQVATDMILERLKTERTFAQHERISQQSWGRAGKTGLVELAIDALFSIFD